MLRRLLLSALILGSVLVACSRFSPSTPTPAPTAPPPTRAPGVSTLRVDVDESLDLAHFRASDALTLVFNQPMAPASAAPALDILPAAAGGESWDETRTRLTFTPAEGFAPGAVYTLTLNAQLHSASGEALAASRVWTLTVLKSPRVVKRLPLALTLDERRPDIQLTFSHEMNAASVAEALSVTPEINYTLRWVTTTLHIEFQEPFTPDIPYRFTLADSAHDVYGAPLEADYHWSYWTEAVIAEVTGPTADDRFQPLTIAFNYAMDTASVQKAATLSPAVSGRWEWSAQNDRATFTPDAPFTSGLTYTVAFAGPLFDAAGDPFPPLDDVQFVTPPPILRYGPLEMYGQNPSTSIRLTFDRPMNQSATEAALNVEPHIAGSFQWSETTLIFWPGQGHLDENTEYTVTLDVSALGADDQPILREPFVWSFHTGQMPDVASFGEGANAQVLDADGRRAIQFVRVGDASRPLTFELYALSLEQFLDRYSSGFRGVVGRENRPISTEGATLVRSWEYEISGRGGGYGGDIYEVTLPADAPPGLYLLNLVAGHVNDQLIVVLSRNTLMVKQAEGQLAAWLTDINGASQPNVEVSVYARDGQLLAQGVTDANGVFRTNVSRDPQPLIVIARSGDDVTASGLSNEWRTGGGGWWWWWGAAPKAQKYAAYIYTDRPIYKPGQKVYFKAIVRRDDDALLSMLPENTALTVRVRDARNNVVQTLALNTNQFGTANAEFQLAEGAMLGTYAIEVEVDGEGHRQAFKVQDYRKPDYDVTVTTGAPAYVMGDTVRVTIDTRYFFGEPVPNAQITLKQYELGQNYYYYEDEAQPRDDFIWFQSGRQAITLRTDAEGRATTTLVADMGYQARNLYWWSPLQQATWGIEATVDDGSHQTVSSFAVVKVYNSAEKLRVDSGGYLKAPGQPFLLQADVVTILDEPVNGRALSVRLLRYNYGASDYTEVVQSASMTTGADGRALLSFTANEPGYYKLTVSASDPRGNAYEYSTWLYVFSETATWANRYTSGISIAADKDTYAPGESARLMIWSSMSGPALLTFERGTTRREQLVNLTAPMTVVDVPIQPDDAPNIFVTVNVWEPNTDVVTENTYQSLPDGYLRTASVELRVPVADKTLTVTLTPDRQTYAPREQAAFTVRVTNARGEPVSAEVSLALVDEAIFSLSEELSGPIFDAFYYERDHIVSTYDSLALFRYLFSAGWGGGGGDGNTSGSPRSNFPDTAAWFPVLHTDWNGEATITVTLPDSLTSWRLTAKAATADTQVGEAHVNVTTQQPIVVRPILPRTLTVGDAVELSAIVHNYSGARRTIEVSIAPGERLAINSPITQTITLNAGELGVVGWSAAALSAGEAHITVVAASGDVGDAVRLPLPINPLSIPDVTSLVGEFTGEFNTFINLPSDALGISTVKIELSRSIAGSLLTGLDYLTGYPYGCVEQTMSRALPNAVVGRAFHQLGIGNPTLQADLPPKINAGLQKLYGYQHNDGGWGWWFDDSTHDYQTAWVVFGLAVTKEAGYEVDAQVIKRGADWLAANLDSMDARTRAYALYSLAMAGYGDLEETLTLAHRLGGLDTFSRAALALALDELGARAEARAIVDYLADTAVQRDGKVFWPDAEEDGHYYDKTMSSTTRSTALALSAFVRVAPNHELEPGIVRWLMSQRRREGWGSTNETSFAILALTDHLLAVESATANTNYSVELNGQTIASGALGPGEPAVSLEISAEQMARGGNTLRITQSGGGKLYYVINSRIYQPQTSIEAAGSVSVSRAYLDPRTDRPITSVEAGQLVKIVLTVNLPDDGFYIIVEDKLPGGLEALNEGLNITSHEGSAEPYLMETYYYWQAYGYNNKEVYADRVSFFITELGKGQRTFTYYARATRPGQFVALPVEVYAMYDLTVWGRSASDELQVTGR